MAMFHVVSRVLHMAERFMWQSSVWQRQFNVAETVQCGSVSCGRDSSMWHSVMWQRQFSVVECFM